MVVCHDGRRVPREAGYRKLVVFRGLSDQEPALYASTISPYGSLILRSNDGRQFQPTIQPVLSQPNPVWSFRALLSARGRLFAAPAGRVRGELIDHNTADAAVVLENSDPMRQPWRRIGDHGFGDRGNKTVYELAALNDHLYAATFNPDQGFQVWKTLVDADPHHWVRVVTAGGFRGKANEAAASLCVFRGALYIGTGAQGSHRTGAAQLSAPGAEILRLNADDWVTLLVGAARRTPRGLRWPASGLGPGFGRASNRLIWEMVVYDDWLYTATADASSLSWAILRLFGSRRGRATGLFGTPSRCRRGLRPLANSKRRGLDGNHARGVR
jgi:hypothetical protein